MLSKLPDPGKLETTPAAAVDGPEPEIVMPATGEIATKVRPGSITNDELDSRIGVAARLMLEHQDYKKVADVMGISVPTLRGYLRRFRQKVQSGDYKNIGRRLRRSVAPLAVDAIEDGLQEIEDPVQRAALGVKVLHGLGELRSHSAIKSDTNVNLTELTIKIVDPPIVAGELPTVLDGEVLGTPRALNPAFKESAVPPRVETS